MIRMTRAVGRTLLFGAVALVAGVACDQGTGPGTQWEPDLSSPQQFMLTGDPELYTGYGPFGPFISGWAILPDSFAAIHWIGTRVTIESDRGYRQERLIAPFACLLPSDDPYDPEFPYTFKWLHCDGIGVITHERLTVQRREEFEELLGGVLQTYYEFQTMPGGSYIFHVDIGLAETKAAMDLAQAQPEVDTTFHDSASPPCITSRDYPPPPLSAVGLRRRDRLHLRGGGGGHRSGERGRVDPDVLRAARWSRADGPV